MAAFQYSVQSDYGLSDDQIRQYAPSVFAQEPHESCSNRYGYVPTSMILSELRAIGFVPTMAMQSKARTEDRQEKTKHLLRFRRRDELGKSKPDVFEAVTVNSHDRTSPYDLYPGIFRIVCANGQIAMAAGCSIKVHHRGDIVRNVVESTLKIVEEAEEVMDQVDQMKSIQLTRSEQLLLAELAIKARFDLLQADEQGQIMEAETVYTPESFLQVHRLADMGHNDLYAIGNILQENGIRGNVEVVDNQGKKHKSKPLRSIDQQTRYNILLWQLEQRFMELKRG